MFIMGKKEIKIKKEQDSPKDQVPEVKKDIPVVKKVPRGGIE